MVKLDESKQILGYLSTYLPYLRTGKKLLYLYMCHRGHWAVTTLLELVMDNREEVSRTRAYQNHEAKYGFETML